MGFNKIMLIGQTLRVPELKWVSEHEAVSEFSVVMAKTYRTAEGVEKRARTEISVVAYGPLAERCAAEAREGHEIFIEGRLRLESLKGEEGDKPRTRYCVVAH